MERGAGKATHGLKGLAVAGARRNNGTSIGGGFGGEGERHAYIEGRTGVGVVTCRQRQAGVASQRGNGGARELVGCSGSW